MWHSIPTIASNAPGTDLHAIAEAVVSLDVSLLFHTLDNDVQNGDKDRMNEDQIPPTAAGHSKSFSTV